MPHPPAKPIDNSVSTEVQLILAEKRTSLALMRTGIAVIALPLSVLSVLIATSKLYQFASVMHFLAPLLVLCTALVLLGFYLIFRAVLRIRRCDNVVNKLKKTYTRLADFIE